MKEKIKRIYAWARLNVISPSGKYALSLEQWKKLDFWMLLQLFPNLEYDDDFSIFMIPDLELPSNIKEDYSRLLVPLPVSHDQRDTYPNRCPDSFYLDSDLHDLNENYIIDELRGLNLNFELFNDRLEEGYGRFLLPVKKWQPSWDIISGDNLVKLVDKITFTIMQFGR